MPSRTKFFLTFAVLCTVPLLLLSLLNLVLGIRNAESILRNNLDQEVLEAAHHYEMLVGERGLELTALARGPLRNYLRAAGQSRSSGLAEQSPGVTKAGIDDEAAASARNAISNLPAYYGDIACFDPDKHLLFLSQGSYSLVTARTFRSSNLIPGTMEPEESVWSRQTDSPPRCSIFAHVTFGDVRRCSVPIYLTPVPGPTSPRGVLLADMRLDQLLLATEEGGRLMDAGSRRLLVLDSTGKIVYHRNEALRQQPLSIAIPGFAPLAQNLSTGQERGRAEFGSADGETWLVASSPIEAGLTLVVARNYSQIMQPARSAGLIGIALAILLGLGAALLLTSYFGRKTQRFERVAESVAAIAGGNLNQRVEAPSSDDMRPLADGVNLVTERLREQLSREAEARQFESFIKLSALLTHDLKNAIEGLSLMVGNMERHFDNAEFRADALQALTLATDKLRQIVSRLSHPVNTLSGEFKVPRPTDLIPFLERVLAQIVDPVRGLYEVEIKLPESLPAVVDIERIEKVMENLLLNAIEAMADAGGKLTIEAGPAGQGKVFFSIADTGPGMTPEFMRDKLFRPFATTKDRGVGLGLYTCREVVRANNGVIEVDSRIGYGTTFRVVLASAPLKASGSSPGPADL